MLMENIYFIVIGALWSVIGAGMWFAIRRLVGAIDHLSDTVDRHALDLVEIKTKLEFMK